MGATTLPSWIGRALHVSDDVADELGVDATLVQVVSKRGRRIAALRLDEFPEG